MDPGVKASVASEYANDPILANFEDYGLRPGISQPFRMRELGKVLNDVLSKS